MHPRPPPLFFQFMAAHQRRFSNQTFGGGRKLAGDDLTIGYPKQRLCPRP
jgi:hypothetical protein